MAKKKLNSMRILEQQNVPYEALHYPATLKDAEDVAQAVNMPPHAVYKTLVVQSVASESPLLVMIASKSQLDLKKMARAAGEKNVKMASQKDAEKLTGLQVGGISGLALMHKNWPVYLDRPAAELDQIVISGGQRGTQLKLSTQALIDLLDAQLVDVSKT